jgi:hypothetical protein
MPTCTFIDGQLRFLLQPDQYATITVTFNGSVIRHVEVRSISTSAPTEKEWTSCPYSGSSPQPVPNGQSSSYTTATALAPTEYFVRPVYRDQMCQPDSAGVADQQYSGAQAQELPDGRWRFILNSGGITHNIEVLVVIDNIS